MDDDDMEMDMTPMIDVSFQLLIFFLLTINFKLREGNLSSHLPKKGGAPTESPTEQLTKLQVKLSYDEATNTTSLAIDHEIMGEWKDGEIMNRRKAIGGKAWNSYRDIKKGMDKLPPVKISAGPTVPTGRVITIVDILKEYVIDQEKGRSGKNVELRFRGANRATILNAIQ